VQLGARFLHSSHDVGHSGLVGKESSQVGLLRIIVSGKRLHLSTVSGGSLSGEESQRTVSWSFKLTMRHR
jgi:hypothetical protein